MIILSNVIRAAILIVIEIAVLFVFITNVLVPLREETFEFVGQSVMYAWSPLLIVIALITLFGLFKAGRILAACGLLLGPAAFVTGLLANNMADSSAAGFLLGGGIVIGIAIASIGFILSALGSKGNKDATQSRDSRNENILYFLVAAAMLLPIMLVQALF